MREVRFEHEGSVYEGVLEGDATVTANGETLPVADVDLRPPCRPRKIVGVGVNFPSILEKYDLPEPNRPDLFFKPPNTLAGHKDDIVYPSLSERVVYEGELGAIIAKHCREVDESDAAEYVAGYTCANDITAQDWTEREDQWVRSKGFDGFTPVGPAVQTAPTGDLRITTRVNGEPRQSTSTDRMLFSVAELVSEVSRFMSLEAGDLLLCGTPRGIATVQPGDTIEIEIEAVGCLSNTVVRTPRP